MQDDPPSIQKPNRRESLANFMVSMKMFSASKLSVSGMEFIDKKDFEAALVDFKEAQELYQELGEEANASNMLSLQGLCYYALCRWEEAAIVLKEAIALKACLNDTEGKASDLLGLGEVYLKAGDGLQAEHAFGEALLIFEERGIDDGKARACQGVERSRKILSSG